MGDILHHLSRTDYYPVMGEDYSPKDVSSVRLGPSAYAVEEYSYDDFESFLYAVQEEREVEVLYGGYGERRHLYRRAPQYNNGNAPREYHLGVDVWCSPGQSVYSPWDGTVISSVFREKPWDYGGLIILRHTWSDQWIHTLYGHVSKQSVDRFSAGDTVLQGDALARIADRTESGGWVPHLHLQSMKKLYDYVDDFPGVISQQKLKPYLANCPDPTPILFQFET